MLATQKARVQLLNFLLMCPGEQMQMTQVSGCLTHVEKVEKAPDSWLHSGPSFTVAAILGVDSLLSIYNSGSLSLYITLTLNIEFFEQQYN